MAFESFESFCTNFLNSTSVYTQLNSSQIVKGIIYTCSWEGKKKNLQFCRNFSPTSQPFPLKQMVVYIPYIHCQVNEAAPQLSHNCMQCKRLGNDGVDI